MDQDPDRSHSSPSEEPFTTDEWILASVLTLGVPLLICLTVFVVIILAFTGWKLY